MNKGMSQDMYDFIIDNKHKLKYILEEGKVITPKGTNGTVCSSTGYLRVKVSKRTLQVHQVLSVIYYGMNNVGMTVNHIDGNKLNNKKENLEVISLEDNVREAFRTGIYDNNKKRKVKKYTLDGEFICSYETVAEASRDSGANNTSILRAMDGYHCEKTKKRTQKTAGGYKWSDA